MQPSDRSLAQSVRSLTGTEPVLWESMAWPDVQSMHKDGGDMCLLPIGATEQHGRHLPLNTDTLIATATCMYASAKTRVPMLPALAYGCSLGHTDRWPGTISLFPETL